MKIDYILNKSIKILFSFIIAISIVIISLFALPPSYAISIENFEILYRESKPSDSQYVDGYSLATYDTNRYYFAYLTTEIDQPIYCFMVNDTVYIVFDTLNNTYPSGQLGIAGNWSGSSGFSLSNVTQYDNQFYYANSLTFPKYTPTEYFCPSFSSINDGMTALKTYIDNASEPEPSLYEGLNIPPGYIARIQVKNGSKFTMLTTMGTDNIAYQDKWVYTSQWYKFNDTSNPETAMSTDGITIPWVRYGNTNILGQTNKAQYTINSTVGSYVWVLNPAYMVGQNADLYDTKLNSSIQLTDVVDILQVRIFALKSTYTWGGIVSSTSTGSGIEYDSESGNWVNDNGDTVDPVDYGDTNVPTTGTTLIQQFETLLSNLINRIERLLVAPVDYINQLIQSANQFFLWLRGLWSWLPGPVVESISAVLIIMCTVGALKLLWR